MSSPAIDYRAAITNALTALQKKELALKQPFKARAYRNVIQQILHLDHPVTRMDDLAGIRGIGDAIQLKLQEIFSTGHLQAADAAEEKYSLALRDDLQKIYGVGPAFATKLIEEHGVQSIDHLRRLLLAKPNLLNKNQQVGLRYYEDLQQRIPREEMDQHAALLRAVISEVEMDTVATSGAAAVLDIVGSYRRGAPTSGDIDVLLKDSPDHPADLNAFVRALQQKGYLLDILALGSHKCMGVCRLSPDLPARRIDLLVTPAEEYPYALLYFTGSDRFNVAMRQHALQRGISMNEKTMTPPPAKKVTCERDIFHALGLAYVAPERRVDHQQIRPLKRRMPVFQES